MLKNIGLLILISISSNTFASEYKVTIKDNINGEVVVTNCENELDLFNLSTSLVELKEEGISFKVNLIKESTDVIKKGGGEGGTD